MGINVITYVFIYQMQDILSENTTISPSLCFTCPLSCGKLVTSFNIDEYVQLCRQHPSNSSQLQHRQLKCYVQSMRGNVSVYLTSMIYCLTLVRENILFTCPTVWCTGNIFPDRMSCIQSYDWRLHSCNLFSLQIFHCTLQCTPGPQ